MSVIAAVALTLAVGLVCVTSAGIRVKAPLGGNATVVCPYQKGNEGYPKYFSKQRPGERIVTVRSNQVRTWSTDGRFSLEDDQARSEFTVIIRNLSVEDAGLYWCGVDWWRPDYLIEVNLDVVQVQITPSSPTFSPQNEATVHETTLSSTGQQNNRTFITGLLQISPVMFGSCLAVALLLCGVMTGICIKVKRSRTERTTATRSGPSHSRDQSNHERAEGSYMRMNPIVRKVGSSVDEGESAAGVSMHSREIDPMLPLQTQAGVDPDSADPSTLQLNKVYENLRVETRQNSIYHTIRLAFR